MARLGKGDVAVVRFPFADLTGESVRPAVIVAALRTGDFILCQVTSREKDDGYSIPLTNDAFAVGALNRVSYARPNRLFTAASSIVLGKVGTLKPEFTTRIIDAIISILRS